MMKKHLHSYLKYGMKFALIFALLVAVVTTSHAIEIEMEHGTIVPTGIYSRYTMFNETGITNVVDFAYRATGTATYTDPAGNKSVDHRWNSYGEIKADVRVFTNKIDNLVGYTFFSEGKQSGKPPMPYDAAPAIVFTPFEPGQFSIEGLITGGGDSKNMPTNVLCRAFVMDSDFTFHSKFERKVSTRWSPRINLTEELNDTFFNIKEGEKLVITCFKEYWNYATPTLTGLKITPVFRTTILTVR